MVYMQQPQKLFGTRRKENIKGQSANPANLGFLENGSTMVCVSQHSR